MATLTRTRRASPRRGRGAGPALEALEPRALMSVGVAPSDAEQFMLELVNRARSDPAAEGRRLVALAQSDPLIRAASAGWDLNAFTRAISAYAPMPPLAFNPRLIEAARAQDVSMLRMNSQRHAPAGFLTDPRVAVAADGQGYYDVTNASWSTGENIFAFSHNVNGLSAVDYVNYFHAGFLIDWGNPSFGHLANDLAPGPGGAGPSTHYPYSEVGIGLLENAVPTEPPDPNPPEPGNAGQNVGPDLITQEFGWRSTADADLTGTFFVDAARTGFYAPGEGLGGVTIRAVGRGGLGTFQTQTWPSGGYTLPLPAGTYDVTASGGSLASSRKQVVAIGRDNVGWSVAAPPTPAASIPVPADYDGTGRADLATYTTDTATWTIRHADGTVTSVVFGQAGLDLPVPGRYDGGTRVELAVYRPTTAEWIIRAPGGDRHVPFGWGGHDVPVPGDYDGDGKTDIAVYRPSTAEWFVRRSSDGVATDTPFGHPGLDVPVPADYDGDHRTDYAVFLPTTAEWFVRRSSDGSTTRAAFGRIGVDQPTPRDYDGDGKADIAVFRPDSAEWFIRRSSDGATIRTAFGHPGIDLAAPADYDGDGRADLAVFYPPTADWFVRPTTDGRTLDIQVGRGGTTTTGLAALSQDLAIPPAWYAWTTPIPAATEAAGRPAARPAPAPAGPMALWRARPAVGGRSGPEVTSRPWA